MENKKTKIISIASMIALTLTLITATFAYFMAQTGEGKSTDVNITANTVDTFSFETGDAISLNINQDNFASGKGNQTGITFAKAMLSANNKTNSATEHYYLYLIITGNTFTYTQNEDTPEMLMEITDENGNKITNISSLKYKTVTDGKGNSISGYDITDKKGAFALLENREITTTTSKTEKWNVTVTFVNYDKNQSANAGKSFTAQVLITRQDYENYTPTTINTLTATRSGSNLTVNLNTTEGTSKIDKYYYAIEETNTTTGIVQSKVQKLSNKIIAEKNLSFIQSSNDSYTFKNITDNNSYNIYTYTTDNKNIKSNEYVYNYTANSYVLPTINNLEVTATTIDSMTITLTATKGTNNIAKYYYSIDGGNTFTESTSNMHTFNNLVSGLNYTIIVKVNDTLNKYSNIFVLNSRIVPFTLDLNNYTFSWNKLKNATSYQIYSDGELLTTTTTTSAEIYSYYNDAGTYNINVKALDSSKKELGTTNDIKYKLEKLDLNLSGEYSQLAILKENRNGGSYMYYVVVNKNTPEIYNEETVNILNITNNNYIINYFYVPSNLRENNIFSYDGGGWRYTNISNIFNPNICSISNYCTKTELKKFSYNANSNGLNFYYNSTTLKLEAHNQDANSPSIPDTFFVQLVEPGKIGTNWFQFEFRTMCLSENTEVYVYDEKKKKYRKKKIGDLTYDDELLCWDFDNGCFAKEKPIWIMKEKQTFKFNRLAFSDGSILETINQHRIFNVEKGMFTYPMTDDTPIGTTTLNANREHVKLISKEEVEEPIKYYNIMTNYHINLFANDILTSSRLSNIYKIEDLKYVKDDRELNDVSQVGCDEKWIKGLRLEEQPLDINKNGYSVGTLKDYINNLKENMKNR